MDERIAEQLSEIAGLLRRRLEIAERQQMLHEEQKREAAESIRKMTLEMPKLELPTFDHDEAMKRIEERGEEDRRERIAFQRDLLAEIKRHNDLLEKLIADR